jgi:magnesium-transporting ATPase (P-type)
MVLGMSLATFTLLHVVISLVGIASGLVVLFRMVRRRRVDGWNELFLVTTIATSVTGFLFPFHGFGPAHIVGALSLIVLAVALFALYGQGLAGIWRPIYADCAAIALYLNVFVGVVQAFDKVSSLKALAPTQSEPPYVATQALVLVLFIITGFLAQRRFRGRLRF